MEFIKYNVDYGNILDIATPWLHKKMDVLFQPENIEDSLTGITPKLQESLEMWVRRGSRWSLNRIMNLQINISKYRLLHAGSYLPLPKEVWARKKAVVNVKKEKKNEDNDCLRDPPVLRDFQSILTQSAQQITF